MLLILDNYDSFTYNLVQYFGELGVEMAIHRNDALTVDEVKALAPEKICISPGPCTPNEAGISLELIRELGPTITGLMLAGSVGSSMAASSSWTRTMACGSSRRAAASTAAQVSIMMRVWTMSWTGKWLVAMCRRRVEPSPAEGLAITMVPEVGPEPTDWPTRMRWSGVTSSSEMRC